MTIDWESFTPWASLAGGMMIGLAAAMLLLLNGRIMGVSGIVSNVMLARPGSIKWAWAWLLGVLSTPFLFTLLGGQVPVLPKLGWAWVTLAGLFVGVGTNMGSGCTSGHGVCGLSRLSRRSVFAVMAFMGSGMATVYILRHWF